MQQPFTRYQAENGYTLVEIELNTVQQLFNSLDPAPFRDKDLDKNAEEYITDAIQELPMSTLVKLVFYLPADQLALAESSQLAQSIHNYFDYCQWMTRLRLRLQLREGRWALVIGLGFLFICLSLRALIAVAGPTTLDAILAEGLLILGWVAMWRPLEVFLYAWWPIARRAKLYDKLKRIPIEVRPKPTELPATRAR
ncbi:MAG: hypothetical protein U1F68_20745 [Gammaproteobacteria bacterium]